MARRVHHVENVVGLARHALRNGATVVRPRSVEWDASWGCETPVFRSLEGRSSVDIGYDEWGDVRRRSKFNNSAKPIPGIEYGVDQILWLDMWVRCRKCRTCLAARSRLWSNRARREIEQSARTWFGTLTLRPEEHYLALAEVSRELGRRGTVIDRLSPQEQFKERHRVIGKSITKYLKRVRKESEAAIRYIIVAEAHKSGLPHYHALVHEPRMHSRVTERQLRKQWIHGFSKWELVEDGRAARYVCKYLSKAAEARVRASQRYGEAVDALWL